MSKLLIYFVSDTVKGIYDQIFVEFLGDVEPNQKIRYTSRFSKECKCYISAAPNDINQRIKRPHRNSEETWDWEGSKIKVLFLRDQKGLIKVDRFLTKNVFVLVLSAKYFVFVFTLVSLNFLTMKTSQLKFQSQRFHH